MMEIILPQLTDNLLDVRTARLRMLQAFEPLETNDIMVEQSADYILSSDIKAEVDIPGFLSSAMDGFAVRSSDLVNASKHNPIELKVVVDIPAGKLVEEKLQVGQAARIMTGAPLPEGADAIVPVEQTDFNYRYSGLKAPGTVKIYDNPTAGAHIRQIGEDAREGDLVISAGQRLRAQELGLLSMLGIKVVSAYRKPRVGVFSSGDELLEKDKHLQPGKIYDANRPMLISLVEQAGAVAIDLGISQDNEQSVLACLRMAVDANADLIISTAGVSVGAFDFVRTVVEKNGHLDFWRVNMRPGKPICFGDFCDIPFIGLPGNPVAAFVGFHVFISPAIFKMRGGDSLDQKTYKVKLLEAIESDGRESYLRVIINHQGGELSARLTGHQGSGNLRSLVDANGLLIVPSGVKSMPADSYADVCLIDDGFPEV